jgi:ADP-ribosyl-[dinitrogen reductase] hydrolase
MDNALGCMMGVLVGDASGAVLEFKNRFNDDDVNDAMHMKGGGALNIGRGQITDDGELTLALAHSLTGQQYYPVNTVAKAYNSWMQSMPFDVGATCRKAFSIQGAITPDMSYCDTLLYKAAKYNMFSEANGALMRCSPIAVWAHKESPIVITQYAKLDAMLSHPNQVCLECNAIYVLALAMLIRNNGDSDMTFDIVQEYIENSVTSVKVKKWFQEDRHETPEAKRNIGHVRHAFCMAMNFLEKPVEYEDGIRDVLKLGGDTDTNAAICGGILGAINGYANIPDYMKTPVLSFEYNADEFIGYDRPTLYKPQGILNWVEHTFNI